MTYQEIVQQISTRKFQPVYLLQGDEPFYIDELTTLFEDKVLSEGEKAFNFTMFYGEETDFRSVVDTARRYPMMCEYQLVIVREAQEMKTLGELSAYVEKPTPSTILVICHKHKKIDARTNAGKILNQKSEVFESKKLYDNQVPDWIINYLKDQKLNIKPDSAAMLSEYLGNDLSRIVNELQKLSMNLPVGTYISAEHIEKYIGISKEYNVFELTKALSSRDISKCNKIVLHLNENSKRNPFIATVATIYGFFSKVYMLHFLKGRSPTEQVKALGVKSEWAMKEHLAATRFYSPEKVEYIIGQLSTYDLRAKGVNNVNTGEEELLRELIAKILI
ncbi:MAG: DNA polymerase III subunit delta [Saprospiraceae bacterium]